MAGGGAGQPVKGAEVVEPSGNTFEVAGRQVIGVSNVTRPTLTAYSRKGKNTGVAVVVFPGGGYQTLAIDLEGTEVCDWLTSRGITCVLLKYRVRDVGPYPKSGPYPESRMALEDAQRTVGLARSHAAEWKIDPHKIGVLGFSAGGHLAAAIGNNFEQRLYAAVDAADKESPAGFRGRHLSGAYVFACRGMGCAARHEEICDFASGTPGDDGRLSGAEPRPARDQPDAAYLSAASRG